MQISHIILNSYKLQLQIAGQTFIHSSALKPCSPSEKYGYLRKSTSTLLHFFYINYNYGWNFYFSSLNVLEEKNLINMDNWIKHQCFLDTVQFWSYHSFGVANVKGKVVVFGFYISKETVLLIKSHTCVCVCMHNLVCLW